MAQLSSRQEDMAGLGLDSRQSGFFIAPENLRTMSRVTQQVIRAGWTRVTLNPKLRLDGHFAIGCQEPCVGVQSPGLCAHGDAWAGGGGGGKDTSFKIWIV